VLNASIATSAQTPSGSPSGPSYFGHFLLGFDPTLPRFPFGGSSLSSTRNPNPCGTIPSFTLSYQLPIGGKSHQGSITQPRLSWKN
jgi:hypothetical protein